MRGTGRILLQPGYVLHHRDYRDTSRILDVFTRDYGRLRLIAKGVRRATSPWRGLLQPFRPLLLSWTGRGELGTLIAAESGGSAGELDVEAIFGGFYLNELLLRLTVLHDPHPALFAVYAETVACLPETPRLARHLRLFEKRLLEELGYGLSLDTVVDTGQPVRPDGWYRYRPGGGLVEIAAGIHEEGVFPGASLLALRDGLLDDAAVLRDARQLLQRALDDCLGGRPLATREVARAMKSSTRRVRERQIDRPA